MSGSDVTPAGNPLTTQTERQWLCVYYYNARDISRLQRIDLRYA